MVVLCLLAAAPIIERMKECLVKHSVKQDLEVLCMCMCVHVCVRACVLACVCSTMN